MDNPLPIEALNADICTLAIKGAGKTVCNKANVERLLDDGRRVVILDPLNNWFGLRVLADGSPGYPIVIIGGPRGDFPLDVSRGKDLGEFIAKSDQSYILDVSDLVKSDLIKFTTAFLTALYRTNRSALWLILEEGDVFIPQNPSTDGSRAMADAVDMIVRRGRNFGFRLWSITQRPARISKDVTSMASTVILLRILSPQDRNAVEEWVKGNAIKGQAADVIASLATLEVGEGYIWSPEFDIFKRVRFPMIKTLDTSSTPQHGEAAKRIVLGHVDTSALQAALPVLATTVAGRGREATPATPLVDLDVIRAEAHRKGFAEGRSVGIEEIKRCVLQVFDAGETMALASTPSMSATAMRPPVAPVHVGAGQMAERTRPSHDAPAVRAPPAAQNAKGARTLLEAAAKTHPVRLTWGQVCLFAGRKPSGGHFNSSRKAALDLGWLVEKDDLVAVGTAGAAEIGLKPRDRPLIDIYAEVLPEPAKKFFAAIRRHPHGVTPHALAESLGMKAHGGHWNTGVSTLRRNGLITDIDGLMLVSPAITGVG